jgi:glucokinase
MLEKIPAARGREKGRALCAAFFLWQVFIWCAVALDSQGRILITTLPVALNQSACIVNTNPAHFLAIEIGGTKLQIVAGTDSGQILERRRFAVERSAGGEGIRNQIAGALPVFLEEWKPRAIGCGYGGPVDWRTGRINRSHHVAGWEDFPLGSWLSEQSGLPAVVDNDANVAALGEALHGAGKGHSPVFYFNSGTGVGGGLVAEGRIYHGTAPGEMEFGHLRMDREGTILEDLCAGREVDRQIRDASARRPQAILSELVALARPGSEARQLVPALEKNCPLAGEFLDRIADNLAFALGHVVHLLHPAVMVFGGGLSLIGEPLRARIATALPRYVMEAFAPGPPVALAGLGEDAVPVGALALARR